VDTVQVWDGINLRTFETEKFGVNSLCVLFRNKLKRNEVTINALLASVLDCGTMKYGSRKNFRAFLEENNIEYYADIVKKGEEQIIELYFEFMPSDRKSVFELIADIINQPFITDDVVERKKEVLKKTIHSRIDDKKIYAKERCIELMCEGEPFSLCGDGYEEDIDYITTEDVKNRFKSMVNTAAVEIFSVGTDSEYDICRAIVEYLPLKGRYVDMPTAEWQCGKKAVREEREACDVVQTRLCVGIRTNIPPLGNEWYNAMVANELLGGSSNSLLFSRVREKEGLCYYISSTLYRYKALMVVQAGIKSENCEAVTDMIKKAFSEAKKGFEHEDTVEAAKAVANRILMTADSASGIMDFYLGQVISGDKPMSIEVVSKKTAAVTKSNEFLKSAFIDTVYVLEG
jgi:predicted Zn-dependent peptidase